MVNSMPPIDSGMAPTEAEIEQARLHVADVAQAVEDQRRRLERLRRTGHPTQNAEELLATFEDTLRVMREHLAIEESFDRDKPDAST